MHKLATLLGGYFLVVACATSPTSVAGSSPALDAARNIVDAVNAKDSRQYVRDLSEDVVVTMYDGDVRLRGRVAVQANREQHFKNYPDARNALLYLVEIDNRVVMHDQVWLSGDAEKPADIVEVLTFDEGKIVRIDVIQPRGLFVTASSDRDG